MNIKMDSTKVTKLGLGIVSNEEIDNGTSDVTYLNNLQSSERHTDFTAYYLSERWGIILSPDTRTLNKTIQKLLCGAILPLDRRYCTDIVFTRKKMQGQWLCDKMNGGFKLMDDNQYAQVFANNTYFSKVYQKDSNKNSGDALKLLF